MMQSILPTRDRLARIGKAQSSNCQYCDHIPYSTTHLLSCNYSTAWSKNEGGFEFHRHKNKKFNKLLQKSCNMLTACLKHIASYVSMQNSVRK